VYIINLEKLDHVNKVHTNVDFLNTKPDSLTHHLYWSELSNTRAFLGG